MWFTYLKVDIADLLFILQSFFVSPGQLYPSVATPLSKKTKWIPKNKENIFPQSLLNPIMILVKVNFGTFWVVWTDAKVHHVYFWKPDQQINAVHIPYFLSIHIFAIKSMIRLHLKYKFFWSIYNDTYFGVRSASNQDKLKITFFSFKLSYKKSYKETRNLWEETYIYICIYTNTY